MQALAGVANEFGQAAFDVQVHVLERELPLEPARSISASNLTQSALDC